MSKPATTGGDDILHYIRLGAHHSANCESSRAKLCLKDEPLMLTVCIRLQYAQSRGSSLFHELCLQMYIYFIVSPKLVLELRTDLT